MTLLKSAGNFARPLRFAVLASEQMPVWLERAMTSERTSEAWSLLSSFSSSFMDLTIVVKASARAVPSRCWITQIRWIWSSTSLNILKICRVRAICCEPSTTPTMPMWRGKWRPAQNCWRIVP